jgi:hypothetical protein
MYVYDRRSQRAWEIARAPQVNGKTPPPVPGYTGPAVVGERVYWAQVSQLPPRAAVDLYRCKITACTPELVAHSTAFPASSGRALYAVRADKFGPQGKGSEAIVKVSGGRRRAHVVTELDPATGKAISSLSASHGHLAWTELGPRASALTVVDYKGVFLKEIAAPRGESYGFVSAGNDFIVYSNFGGTGGASSYAYSLSRDRIFTLGDTSGYYFVAAGPDAFAWQQKARDGDENSPVEWVVVTAPGGRQ